MKKKYTSDLTDAEWQVIQSILPVKIVHRKRKYKLRIIFNAIFYLLKNGCLWRDLPNDFPPHGIVNYYFTKWKKDGMWNNIHQRLYGEVRQKYGRDTSPSVGLLDSQTIKTGPVSGQKDSGLDANKKIRGRKRQIIVDTLGLIIVVFVHAANIQDRDGARLILKKLLKNQSIIGQIKYIIADAAYRGPKLGDWFSRTFKRFKWILKTINRPKPQVGFKVNSMLWIAERTFAWLLNFRRLSKDYERRTDTSEAFIQIAMIKLMSQKLVSHQKTTRVLT